MWIDLLYLLACLTFSQRALSSLLHRRSHREKEAIRQEFTINAWEETFRSEGVPANATPDAYFSLVEGIAILDDPVNPIGRKGRQPSLKPNHSPNLPLIEKAHAMTLTISNRSQKNKCRELKEVKVKSSARDAYFFWSPLKVSEMD